MNVPSGRASLGVTLWRVKSLKLAWRTNNPAPQSGRRIEAVTDRRYLGRSRLPLDARRWRAYRPTAKHNVSDW
jgi:hypothetical protein